jgi:hypothetical protein
LSYVFDYNVDGIVGPENNIIGNDVELDANHPGKGLVVFRDSLSDVVNKRSELAKLRYRLSDTTSLSGAFVGFQGQQNPQGVSSGSYVGPVTIEPSLVSGGTTQYNAPYAQGLDGQTVPGFIWYPGTITSTNQPFFEGELRTAVGNDTLLLRPYTGVITRFVDGNAEALYPDAIYGTGWTKAADGSYQEAFQSAYDEIEVNRLHGTTFTYLHPFGDNFLNFTYDYHSAFIHVRRRGLSGSADVCCADHGTYERPLDKHGALAGAEAQTGARRLPHALEPRLRARSRCELARGPDAHGFARRSAPRAELSAERELCAAGIGRFGERSNGHITTSSRRASMPWPRARRSTGRRSAEFPVRRRKAK